MLCEVCKKNAATVHVTELTRFEVGADAAPFEYDQRHLCVQCAGVLDLPSQSVGLKVNVNVWKLLDKAREQGPSCPACGLGLRDFKQTGKLGCPECYQAFGRPLRGLLLRMHNAQHHSGRGPRGAEATGPPPRPPVGARKQPTAGMTVARDASPAERLAELQQRLANAVQQEHYEDAARIRDEIEALERTGDPGSRPT